MRNNSATFGLLVLCSFFLSCERPPEFPDEPTIAFDKVEFFKNVPDRSNTNQVDRFEISVSFKDGDGDLGLVSDDIKDHPYHEATYFLGDSAVYNISEISTDDLLEYGDSDTLPEYNEAGQEPEDCLNYKFFIRQEITSTDTIEVTDTVYMQLNENAYNFFVDVYIKENGEFVRYDFFKRTCIPISGRFTLLNTSDNKRPLEGILTYKFETSNLQDNYFGDETLKLKIQIQDRDLHKSNIVETPEFTLNQIKAN